MDYQKKNLTPTQKINVLADLYKDGLAQDLAGEAERTDIYYVQSELDDKFYKSLDHFGEYEGVSTGYSGVDELLGSFLPGELLTVGGDTGHGKSLFAMNVAVNVYKNLQQPVLMVNLELTEQQMQQRFWHIAGGGTKDSPPDFAGIMAQKESAVAYKDIDIIMEKAKLEGCALVIIDHLHFFSRTTDNTTAELSRIMKHFKECAVQHKLPVMLLSHVTPTREYNKDGAVKRTHKPNLHNFKGSSSIEQDSDMVAFVYRDAEEPSQMEVYCRKNRSRPLKTESVILTQENWKLVQTWPPESSSPSQLFSVEPQSASRGTAKVTSPHEAPDS